jgi:hypothetical protein
MWWSRKLSGWPGLWASSQSATLHSSTASGFKVDSVDAGPDHIADGGPECRWRRLLFFRPQDSEFDGDSSGSGEQYVSGSAGDISDAQI